MKAAENGRRKRLLMLWKGDLAGIPTYRPGGCCHRESPFRRLFAGLRARTRLEGRRAGECGRRTGCIMRNSPHGPHSTRVKNLTAPLADMIKPEENATAKTGGDLGIRRHKMLWKALQVAW